MSDCDMKDSILKLRELREKLCSEYDQSQTWKEAYEVRDFVVQHLQELHIMIVNRKIRRQKLEDKSSFILDHLSAWPDSKCEEEG